MSLATAFGSPFDVEIDGKTYSFSLLRMKQLAQLVAKYEARRLEKTKKITVQEGLGMEATARFRSMNDEEVEPGHLVAWAFSLEGAKQIVTLGLAENGHPKDLIDQMAVGTMQDIAKRLVGWEPEKKSDPKSKPEGEQGANPCESGEK